jgi:hypothetical protein
MRRSLRVPLKCSEEVGGPAPRPLWEITLASNALYLKAARKPAFDFAWSERNVAEGQDRDCQPLPTFELPLEAPEQESRSRLSKRPDLINIGTLVFGAEVMSCGAMR